MSRQLDPWIASWLVAALLLLGPRVSQGDELAADLERFLAWFPGEYDNHEQVWQQVQDGLPPEARQERIHHHFVRVTLPAVGDHVFFVLQTLDDDPRQVYRQRLYRFEPDPARGAIRLHIYKLRDETSYRQAVEQPELLNGLTEDDLLAIAPGCEVYWRYNGEYYDGNLDPGACHFYSEEAGEELYMADTLRLMEDEIWIGDKAVNAEGELVLGRATPQVNRKVRRFSGWMGVRRSRVDPAYGGDVSGDEMFFDGKVNIHNEGGRVSLLDDDGRPTGFAIELAQLTYQNTRVPILKLGIIDETSGETLSYTWAATDSSRIGINLRWFQAGLTAAD
jgi:hypothetical protein